MCTWNLFEASGVNKEECLNHMKRNHVHFATGLSAGDGVISGMYSSEWLSLWTNEGML